MATRISGSSSTKILSEIGSLIRELMKTLLDPYRPELHYMRGPGPKVARRQHWFKE
jgi:hypothetical protein